MGRPHGSMYLGRRLGPDGKPTTESLLLDARDLTTHGVIVGMTGSGKTGLGVILIEEALTAGIPALVLDPKGDMTNLALVFPEFRESDFRPWVEETDALRQGKTPDEIARDTAGTWQNGLRDSGIAADNVRAYRDRTAVTIYTPGSLAGVPLNVLGSLDAPSLDWAVHAEVLRDEIQGYVSGLLSLAGIESDPVSGREHILLASLIERAWASGQDLDLPTLVAGVQDPPFRKLGVLDLESFFPAKDRRELAVRLNGVIASPAFQSWIVGPEIDIGALLAPQGSRTACAVIYLAHLSDAERQFVVALVLSRVVTWMQSLSGTSDLRVLVYVDELFGFAPPTANPPAKKPILTLMKQARAFGVGMVLATQNPVDLDYKALGNAGSWFIGRLQTERDKARLAAGLSSARGDVSVAELETQIGALGKRQFLLQSTYRARPEWFTTRWAVSFLRGPLTRDQVAALSRDDPVRRRYLAETASVGSAAPAPDGTAGGAAGPTWAEDESPVPPAIAPGIPVRYLDPRAPWAPAVDAVAGGHRLALGAAAQATLQFVDRRADVVVSREWRGLCWPLADPPEAAALRDVPFEDGDFADEAPSGAVYRLPTAPVDKPAYFRRLEGVVASHLGRTQRLRLYVHPALSLYSRPDETREQFLARCAALARQKEAEEAQKIRQRYEAKRMQAARAISAAEGRVRTLEADVSARRQQEMVGGAGAVLGALLGRRSLGGALGRLARAATGASTRRSMTSRVEERLRVGQAKLADAQAAQAALEGELAADLAAAHGRGQAEAETLTEYAVAPSRGGVTIVGLFAVWLPQ